MNVLRAWLQERDNGGWRVVTPYAACRCCVLSLLQRSESTDCYLITYLANQSAKAKCTVRAELQRRDSHVNARDQECGSGPISY